MTIPVNSPVKYEELAAAYQHALVNVLRGHTAGEDYLELWVPDEDPVKGILNMIEAAQLANRAAVAIEVSSHTIGAEQLQRLNRLAAAFGDVAVTSKPTSYLIEMSELQRSRSEPPRQRTELHQLANVASIAPGIDEKLRIDETQGDTIDHEVAPFLARVVAAVKDDQSHEGQVSVVAGQTGASAISQFGQLAIAADLQTHIIVAARHHGFVRGARRTIANVVCGLIEGRTVQDASDHGGLLAIHDLFDKAARPKVSGILLPSNAGRAFVDTVALLHRVCASYFEQIGAKSTTNYFESPIGERWRALNDTQRMAEASAAVAGFCKSNGLRAGSIRLDRIEKDLLGNHSRVVITIDNSIPAARKPELMRRLERDLKNTIDRKLQLYLEPLKDNNKLRRL